MVLYSVLDVKLSTEKRHYALWYSVFFFRLWRAWLLKHEVYSIEHNFVTLNSYVCVEINAHGMYNMILYHIDKGSFEDFFPYMYSSQPCESYFRLLRSFTPTFSTMVNCDVLEALHKVKRVEQLVNASNTINEEFPINYPRKSQFRSSFDQLDLEKFAKDLIEIPENLPRIAKKFETLNQKEAAKNNMQEILKIAKSAAYRDITNLGIDINITEANNIQVKVTTEKKKSFPNIDIQDNCIERDIDDINEDEDGDGSNREEATSANVYSAYDSNNEEKSEYEDDVDEGEEESDEEFECTCSNASGNAYDTTGSQLELRGLQSNFDLPQASVRLIKKGTKICNNCPFTYVKNKSGKKVLVRKSSIVWMLNRGVARESSDRLARFHSSKRKKDNFELRERTEIKNVIKCDKIYTGDWCLFRDDESPGDLNFIVGLVLHFAKNFGENLKRATWKSIQHEKNYVDVPSDNSTSTVGTLCQWYAIDFKTNQLERLKLKTQGYTEASNYIAHIPQPAFHSATSRCIVTSDICHQIKNVLDK